jgi:TonB-linked SusC/RagA family outer membrane protein
MKKILLFLCVFLAGAALYAQERTISGRVTGDDGSSLPGVNVVVKGTTLGTVTNVNGEYRLSVPSGQSVLVFSFVGFESREVVAGAQSVIDVSLVSDVKQLSEVVITGYGTQEKRTLTGSISSVKGEVIHNLPMQSVDRAIQGRIAGVQIDAASGAPGGAVNVRVRGVGSVNASNDPLWIIDGVQVGRFGQTTQASGNPLGSINPNDIESIEVLKDAASAAIYGAQAANGVVIVTTKKGRKGKTGLDITGQYGRVQPLNLYRMLDGQQFATLRAEAALNSLPPGATQAQRDAALLNSHTVFGNPSDGDLTNFNWVNAMFQTGSLGTYDFSMQGGDEKTTFLVSGSYQFQEAQVIMSDWKRGTARLNITHKPNKKLTIGANLSLAYQRSFGSIANGNFVNSPFQAAFSSQPTSDPFTDDGRWAPYPERSLSGHLFGYNILQGVNEEIRLGRTPQTVSSANISYEILPGLVATGFAGIDASFNTDNNQRPSTIPVFAASGGQALVNSRRTIAWNTYSTLTYSKKFGQNHSFSSLLGFEYRKEERGGAVASQWNFPNPALRLLSQGATARPATEFFFDNARQGVFGQVKYVLKDRYIADVTVRRDGSSRFGSQMRYGNFYAGSVAYRISEEAFLKNVSWLDDLKARVGFGRLGNSEIADYDWFTAFGAPPGTQYVGGSLLRISRLGNDQITWETENQMNAGIDYTLFGGRIRGSLEYFRNETMNQLFDVALPADAGVLIPVPAPGVNTIRGNAGSVLNRGFEIEIEGVVVDRGKFKWTTAINFSTLHNEVTGLPGGRQQLYLPAQNQWLFLGHPVANHYLFPFAGVNPANGKSMIYDTLGNLAYIGTPRDASVQGSPIPRYFGGVTNTFRYKGFTLDIFFQFQGGHQAFNPDLYNYYGTGSSPNNMLVETLGRWQQPGDIANVPRLSVNGQIDGHDQQHGQLFGSGILGSSQFMSDASYVRLKQATLSYAVPNKVLSRLKLAKASFFVQGLNLLTFTRYFGIDPEVVTANNQNAVSAFGVFPVGRQISAGFTLGL